MQEDADVVLRPSTRQLPIMKRAMNYHNACRSPSPPMPQVGRSSNVSNTRSSGELNNTLSQVGRASHVSNTRSSGQLNNTLSQVGRASQVANTRTSGELNNTLSQGRPRYNSRVDNAESSSSKPAFKLSMISEQRVLKAGLMSISEKLTAEQGEAATRLSEKQDGSPKKSIKSIGFFSRLLNGSVELKTCMEGDVAAAQPDLRYLPVDQLLSIRKSTFEFLTESQSHSAHNNFLNTLDFHLFEKLARKFAGDDPVMPENNLAWHALGVRLAVLAGGAGMLKSGWGQPNSANANKKETVPCCWAVALPEADWPSCKVALFNPDELRLQVLKGEKPDFTEAASSSCIGVVWDNSVGIGKDKMLHWEVMVVEAQDILKTMSRASTKDGKPLKNELAKAVIRRQSPETGHTHPSKPKEDTTKPSKPTQQAIPSMAGKVSSGVRNFSASGPRTSAYPGSPTSKPKTSIGRVSSLARCFEPAAQDRSATETPRPIETVISGAVNPVRAFGQTGRRASEDIPAPTASQDEQADVSQQQSSSVACTGAAAA